MEYLIYLDTRIFYFLNVYLQNSLFDIIMPFITNQNPIDGTLEVPFDLFQISFNLSDYNGDLMDYTVETSPDIGSKNGFDVGNGSYSVTISNLSYFTPYTWFVNVTDGTHWTREVYSFMTEPETLLVDSEFNDNSTSEDIITNSKTKTGM